jgi:VWFA-related protein
MQTRSTLTATLMLCAGTLVWAQKTGPGQTPSFRSGVEVVTIDVNVIDRQGLPLKGLGPSDFVVTVAGQQRRVVTADYVDVAAAQPERVLRPGVVPVSTNEGGGVGRLFVFIVDQNTLEAASARVVAKAASRFFDRLTYSDRSALMIMPLGPNVDFTWAHDRVRDALGRVTGMAHANNIWDQGSLSEARDVANRNPIALNTVGARECGNSFAGGATGFGPTAASPGPTGGGGTGSAPAPPAGGGGGTGAGGTGAGGGGGGGGGSTGGATTSSGRSSRAGALTLDSCMQTVMMGAEAAWRSVQVTSLSSLTTLRQVLSALARVNGDKTIVLISGGWPLDDRDQISLITTVAADAAAARATLFTVFVPTPTFSVTQRMMSLTPTADQYLYVGPLETLAGMTGGGSFRAEVGAEGAFERLGRELAGYYRIGIEKSASDLDAKNRHMRVQVSRGGTTVRAREIFDVPTYEDRDWAARMGAALESPAPATGVGLRLTSYVAADPNDDKRLKIVLAGEASRLQPGEATFQMLVRDLTGKRITSGQQPLGEVSGDQYPFSLNISVPPGSYIVRVAVMDSTGRVGSVDHRVEARAVPLGPFAAVGPLLVRVPTTPVSEPRLALDGIRQDERLALELNLEAESGQETTPEVEFEIASTADGPALVHSTATLAKGYRDGMVLAQGMADMRLLPPGQYTVRAKLTSAGTAIGDVRREFVVLEAARLTAAAPTTTTTITPSERHSASAPASAPALTARALGAVPAFALDQVLSPGVLGPFLERVAARPDAAAPASQALLATAQSNGIAYLSVPDPIPPNDPTRAFLKGLTLLSQKKLDPAADSFRGAMRASADFYPAMVYLGACYAAGGNDKEAAGAWRTALIKEGNSVALHLLLTDALLRQGNGDLALQTVEGARLRWPEDEDVKRRYIIASMLAGKQAEGLDAVDELITQHAADEPSLALGLLVLYEAFMNDQPIEGADQDRARMTRFADAYRAKGGPSLALVETWVAATAKKR